MTSATTHVNRPGLALRVRMQRAGRVAVRAGARLFGWTLLSCLVLAHANAATPVSGTIVTNTTWAASQSPYIVSADVTVDAGALLTIQPGVIVTMNAGANLIIKNGGLNAQGTSSAPITITSYRDVANPNPAPAPGDWGQVQFLSGTLSASTLLNYVQIKFGHGIGVTSASPTLNNVSLLDNAGAAITIDLNSSPVGSALTATGNGLNGILVPSGDMLGNVTWGLSGIPYVVAQGIVSVGQSPAITSISPNSVAQGTSVNATITGVRLANAESASTSDPHVTVALQAGATGTSVPVQIAADTSATPGTATLTLQVAAGAVTVPITITAVPPTLSVFPNPLAVPPDNSSHNFTINLSRPDAQANVINVNIDDATVATVSPASGTIAVGQTQASFQLTGKKNGQTVLRVTSLTLAAISVPVYVTPEYAGLNTTYSALVGVRVGDATPNSGFASTLASNLVGVTLGTFWGGMTPTVAIVGTSATLTLTGAGFPANAAVAIQPPDGVVVGAPTVAADGSQISVPITVGINAATTLRQVVLTAGTQPIPPARPGIDRLLISNPLPTIASISPLAGTPGQTINSFTVRGSNLQGAQTLLFQGGDVSVSATPQVSSDGGSLTASIYIAAAAVPGSRVVVVRTPSGDSDSQASAANTFTIANQINATYSPIVSALLGVSVGTTQPASQVFGLTAPLIGVTRGAVITGVTPATGATGDSLTLTLQGRELTGVTALTLTPSTGLTLGSVVVAADGRSMSIPLAIATDASLGARAIQVSAGATPIAWASPSLSQFTVTAPVPQIDSITPNVVLVGTTNTVLTLRGRNFQGATAVRVTPGDGIAISAPTVNGAGDTASVSIAVDAAATLGQRVVSIGTPAGETTLTPLAANTLTLAASAGISVSPLVSPLVGVQLGDAPPATSFSGILAAPLVGVNVGTPPAPTATYALPAANLGLAVGPVALAVEPLGLVAGTSSTLIIHGSSLPANATVTLTPNTGLTLGAMQVSVDGTAVSVPVTVDAAAPLTPRAVGVLSGTNAIGFASPRNSLVTVTIGSPSIDSISPIFAKPGDTLTLTIRGHNFRDVTGFTAEPQIDLVFATQPTVSSDGTQITVGMYVPTTAALGARVIRVWMLGGFTTASGSVANTFTVISP